MSASQFREKVITICQQHRAENRALVFAFLLFDRRHAQVARVLDDPRFYESLDVTAGKFLTVFFIHSEPLRESKKTDIWSDEAERIAQIITNQFELGGHWDRAKPAILFFQVDNNRISHARFASFADNRYDETFMAMKELIKTAADSIA